MTSLFNPRNMEGPQNEITLSELVGMHPKFVTAENVNDFAFAEFSGDDYLGIFQFPFRFNGYIEMYCSEGELSLDLNLKTFKLRPRMAFFYVPGNIIHFHRPSDAESRHLRFYMMAASGEFVQEMERDLSRLYTKSVFMSEDPCLGIPDSLSEILAGYIRLTQQLLSVHAPGTKEALHSLAVSGHHIFRSLWEAKQQYLQTLLSSRSARSQEMVDRFIRLVTDHHLTEHYLAFYAKELGITPKYLSKLVREVTGRSAPDWIDSFLVLEAKNLLKYSDMAIKEIVFKLHFPDQSSFYKFFKLHTGMIPSEYRKM